MTLPENLTRPLTKILIGSKMSELPLDVFQFEQIKYLDLPDILNLCQVNRTFSSICQNPETWRYLIFRDFHLRYDGGDVKEVYMDAYQRVQNLRIPVEKVEKLAKKKRLDFEKLSKRLEWAGFEVVGNEYHLLVGPSTIYSMIRDDPDDDREIPEGLLSTGEFEFDLVDYIGWDRYQQHQYDIDDLKRVKILRPRYKSALISLLPQFQLVENDFWLDPYDIVLFYNYYHPGQDLLKEFRQFIEEIYRGEQGYLTVSKENREEILQFIDSIGPPI